MSKTWRWAAIVAVALAVTSSPIVADEMAGCVDGYARYNASIKQFNLASDAVARAPYCTAIAPEVGYAACEKFIKSNVGTPVQNEWASQVSSNLATVYKKCQAQ